MSNVQELLKSAIANGVVDPSRMSLLLCQASTEIDRLRGLLRELHECGAVTNWMRVSDDLRGRVLAAVGAAVQPSAAVDASHE